MRHQKRRHDQRRNEECRAKRAGGLGGADNALVIGKKEVGSPFDIEDPYRQHRPRCANGEPQGRDNRKYGCGQIAIGRRIGKTWRQGCRHDTGHKKGKSHEPEHVRRHKRLDGVFAGPCLQTGRDVIPCHDAERDEANQYAQSDDRLAVHDTHPFVELSLGGVPQAALSRVTACWSAAREPWVSSTTPGAGPLATPTARRARTAARWLRYAASANRSSTKFSGDRRMSRKLSAAKPPVNAASASRQRNAP